jgi:hypothetical protein
MLPHTKVSPEIQSPAHFYITGIYITSIFKTSTLQTAKLWFIAVENIRVNAQLVVKTDVMLSPGTTSLRIINVGRGRSPTHRPNFWKSTGPRQGKSRVFKTLPAKHITSKAEYTNTQQGLPGIGYTLAHN